MAGSIGASSGLSARRFPQHTSGSAQLDSARSPRADAGLLWH